ncbi:MAG: MFS transporter [Pseudarthrobacter sp.]
MLVLLTAVSPLPTDIYLPAFPQIATDLGASATGIRPTLTTFLVGRVLGQLVIGPRSDGMGRRKPLIVGAAICLLASIATAVVKAMFRSGRTVLSNRNYVGYLVTFCFAFAAMFAYISASPFVLQNILGLSPGTYSLVFGTTSLAIMISAIIATRLAGRVAYRRMPGGGVIALPLTSVALLAVVLTGVSMIPTLVLLFVFQGSVGFIYGNATTLALGEASHRSGTGAAFLGALQFVLGAAVSPLVGLAGDHDARPMGISMAVAAAISAAAFFLLTSNRSASATGTNGQPAQAEAVQAAAR